MKDLQTVIRPIRPEDEPLMVAFHGMLSDRTVYLRYFSALSLATRTDHKRLHRICFADGEREIVLVTLREQPRTGEQSIVAVGRLNLLQDGKEAELAVLVADQYQRKGLGAELVQRLIHAARAKKLTRISAEILRDNVSMQAMLKRFGFRQLPLSDPQSVQAILEL